MPAPAVAISIDNQKLYLSSSDKECYDNHTLVLGGEEVEIVSKFCYLGAYLYIPVMPLKRLKKICHC